MEFTPEQRIARIVRQLRLRPVDQDHFAADVYQDQGRLFGGLILAQALTAAYRTGPRGDVHSLHGYFIRAGKPAMPVQYEVERLRDGRSFATRRVTGRQEGAAIFEATMNFVVPEPGLSHQEPMPTAPPPETQPDFWETFEPPANPTRDHRRTRMEHPIEMREAYAAAHPDISRELPYRAVWVRPVAPLPEDPVVHAALLAFLTDSGIVTTTAIAYGSGRFQTSSLDHAIWFHRPPRFAGWHLFHTNSPAGHAARSLNWGGIWDAAGTRILSVAQEGLYREVAPPPDPAG